MYCTQCGTFNSDERVNCNNCGESMSKSRVTQPRPVETSRLPTTADRATGSAPTGQAGGAGKDDYEYVPGSALRYLDDNTGRPTSPGLAVEPPGTSSGRGASGRSILSLVLSIIGIAGFGPLTSIAGTILGKQELTAINEGRAAEAGRTFAKVGFYLGIITTILYCGMGLVWMAVAALAIFAA
jgi:hypothetical protein